MDCEHKSITFFNHEFDTTYQKYCKDCDSWIHFSDRYDAPLKIMKNPKITQYTITKKTNVGNYENIDVSITFEVNDAEKPITTEIQKAIAYTNKMASIAHATHFIEKTTDARKLINANKHLEMLQADAIAIIDNIGDEALSDIKEEIASRYQKELDKLNKPVTTTVNPFD